MQFFQTNLRLVTLAAGVVQTLISLAACTGRIPDPNASGSDSAGDGDDPGSEDKLGGATDLVGVTSDPVGNPEVNKLTCSGSGIAATPAPLRRLTRTQYINTLSDLLGAIAPVPSDLQLPDEALVDGFDNNGAAQTVSLTLLQGYRNAALSLAKDATSNASKLGNLAPCPQGQAEASCAEKFIADFGKRAFRRPLASDEAARLSAVFKAVGTDFGYAQGIEATLAAILVAPQFLFRPELGSGAVDQGALKLSSHEVASRLSYLIWNTMPDPDLMAAADANRLDTADGVEKELKRMVNDPRAHAAVQRFEAQWLKLAKFDKIEKDAQTFPSFKPATKVSLRASTEKFLEYAFWEKGSLGALLTDTSAYVDETLAPIYGVSAGTAMQRVNLDPNQRSGILTQAGFMAALAKPSFDSPVYRGMFVIRELLCDSVPPVPQGVPTFEAAKPGEPPKTTRARQEQSHNQPKCAACHKRIDGLGFGFSHYDAVGKYRDQENGFDVDAKGELVGTRDIDGPYDGAIELGRKLAQSSQVQQCVATQWFRYGLGKTETPSDSCALKSIVDAFTASQGDMRKLLTILVKSDAFRYRNSL